MGALELTQRLAGIPTNLLKQQQQKQQHSSAAT
jgi:hypothetical protein